MQAIKNHIRYISISIANLCSVLFARKNHGLEPGFHTEYDKRN